MQKSPSSAFTVPSLTSRPIEPVYQVKLLSALRSGDPAAIHPFLAEISKDRRQSVDGTGDIDTGAAALHLAVRCGSVETVSLLLSHRAISANGVHPPGSGTTPLHLAASLGRLDVLRLLLEQENIDDGIRDAHGKTCRDVARSRDVVRVVDDSRSFLNASYRSLFHTYALSPPTTSPPSALLALLACPRSKFIDLSYLDTDTGGSILHEAARRKDLRLIELAVRAGADVFVRNRRGKMAGELGGKDKDERVRVFLRQFANHDKTLIPNPAPPMEPPVLKGYLNKYTNVAKGYNTRWFVLKNGVLSYYRHQDDESIASRGSISMKTALLHTSGGERSASRFEVHSVPPKGQSQSQKWYMKANHPVEAHRWTEAIGKSIEWCRIREREREKEGGGESDAASTRSVGTGMRRKVSEGGVGVGEFGDSASTESAFYQEVFMDDFADQANDGDEENDADEEDEDLVGDNSSAESDKARGRLLPYENISLQGNAIAVQLELAVQLLGNASLATNVNVNAGGPPSPISSSLSTFSALNESITSSSTLFSEFMQMSRAREEWYEKQLRKERTRGKVFEESLRIVVREGEDLEREIKRRRERGKSDGTIRMGMGTTKKRPGMLGLPAGGSYALASPSPVSDGPPPPTPFTPATAKTTLAIPNPVLHPAPPLPQLLKPMIQKVPTDEPQNTDDEDEFFDAIEAGTLPNLVVHEGLASPTTPVLGAPLALPSTEQYTSSPTITTTPSALESLFGSAIPAPLQSPLPPRFLRSLPSFASYAQLRLRLPSGSDHRPSTSLWSVLKHSIGKDLTKISFPVFFNEPTSMLQRMAEDMEFSECLDVASHEEDPLKRIGFVAAFAMSNYSSTIGRIAKPFNPMLSETFEYVRLDKQYRYVSEQVSHHPPISACWAEAPTWHYYGEVDAQNKFMGKSFEIRPTGVAHVDLLLPEDLEPGYPKASGSSQGGGKGKVVEHYSWKKVTTNVSGFILGSPTIDHYGDMTVTNHRTGDTCVLSFKPRGWRGKDAYEISGQVFDSQGRLAYEIAGRWNSQLVARHVGAGRGNLHPDMDISLSNSDAASSTPSTPSSLSHSTMPEYILLWRNSPKPSGSPFNLTPFALTLNDLPKALRPLLPSTDCRLRPDQRAFELGQYEMANELKGRQEEKQRGMRKAREEGREEGHRPRWFVAETDGDTGERVWNPVRDKEEGGVEYWRERERMWREGEGAGGGEKRMWRDVEDIFIEEPEIVAELVEKYGN